MSPTAPARKEWLPADYVALFELAKTLGVQLNAREPNVEAVLACNRRARQLVDALDESKRAALEEARAARAEAGNAERMWVVTRPSGEQYFVDKEPLEGMSRWAAGQDATVKEFRFVAVVYKPPPKKPK
jgi:hypothetical protein